jgi:hypothetical protein
MTNKEKKAWVERVVLQNMEALENPDLRPELATYYPQHYESQVKRGLKILKEWVL